MDTAIPDRYGEDRLVLLVRDPEWLHAYWEVQPETVAGLRGEVGEGRFAAGQTVLRVFQGDAPLERPLAALDEPGAGSPWEGVGSHRPWAGSSFRILFDIPVGEEANNWYVEVKEGGREYRAALGRRLEGGEFLPYVFSNTVITPLGRPSRIVDERWLTLEALYRRAVPAAGAGSSPAPGRAAAMLWGSHAPGSPAFFSGALFSEGVAAEAVAPGAPDRESGVGARV